MNNRDLIDMVKYPNRYVAAVAMIRYRDYIRLLDRAHIRASNAITWALHEAELHYDLWSK